MSQTTILKGNTPAQSNAYVTVDNVTVGGDGVRDPLRVIGGNLRYSTQNQPAGLIVGTPVYSDAGVGLAQASTLAKATPLGLISSNANEFVTVQRTGVLTLTTDEWDAVTGGSGGLTTDASYYVSNTPGGLTTYTILSLAHGLFIALIGIALSETEMLLQVEAASPVAKTP